ncbi:putative peptidoglycan lipid II flippase [Dethiosulfatibacter aminovorans DSM 17477]|uniref:Probable lipid II flippase MurJ n=1 Tax=Dethiosulfatibacter aminovorans DSM 17477 TaxID=1121476 RepID=A0A1M6IH80_9FIRM|nr:murein biosynthesis integral membrane protein MurJ [Dethiosulfatibacter aminovorans]SHJ33726.1 putative peptidoglycan lipid II flippase [Dethiosulfatibacter aminovorans DSM 17477]
MNRIAIYLMLITILSKVTGFARDIVVSYFYGVSSITDAYLISLTIPDTIFAFIGTGIATSFIPIYNSLIEEKDGIAANRFTSNVINLILIISTVITITVLVFTVPAIQLFASGFKGETLKLTAQFVRFSIFTVYFSGLIYVFTAFLQLKNNYLGPALRIIPYNVLIIISIILSSKTDTIVLAIGNIFAFAVQFIFLLKLVSKERYRHGFTIDLNDTYLREMLVLSIPVILGVSINQLNILVDKNIASRIMVGGISALSYSSRLNLFIQGIFVVPITTVMYPMISRMVVAKDEERLKKTIYSSINSVNLLLVPATFGAVLFSKQIVALLFGRGAFDSNAIVITASALAFYSLGMVAVGIRDVLSKSFYAMKDTKTPVINTTIGVSLNIILNILLSRYLGIGGLALATSISAFFTMGLMFMSLNKKLRVLGLKKMTIELMKILLASSAMGVVSKLFFYNFMSNEFNQSLSLVFSIVIGAITYFILVYLMKVEEVRSMVAAIGKRFNIADMIIKRVQK